MRNIFVGLGAVVGSLALLAGSAQGVIVEEVCFDRSSGFADASGMTMSGSASVLPEGVLRLTPAASSQAGIAFANQQLNLNSDLGFDSTFEFRMNQRGGIGDEDGAGADGIAFIFENAVSPTAGGVGGGIGYDGLPNSLAVEFDTYNNGGALGDPNGNHISIHSRGTQPNSTHESASLGRFTPASQMANGQVHTARIRYLPPSAPDPGLTVFYDGVQVLHVAVDLATLLNLDEGNGFVGLSAATGAGWENHDILAWKACTSDGREEPFATAEDDSYTTDEDTLLSVASPGVLENDTAGEGAISVTRASGPSHGALVLGGDGSLEYQPAADYAGPDSFEYTLCADTVCDDATVTILVEEVSSADAHDDVYVTDEDTPLHVDAPGVLSNDTASGRTPVATVEAPPANGTVALDPDGSFIYTPAANSFGADSFEYRMCAGTSCDVATVEVGVREVFQDTALAANPAIATVLPNLKVWLTLSARLTAGGAPQPGQTVRFVVGTAQVCTAKTDADGVASCGGTVPVLLQTVLQLRYSAVFEETPDLGGSTASGPIVQAGAIRLL